MSIYLARTNLSMAGTELTRMEIADAAQIGFLGSAFSTMFAIGRLVNGSLGDCTPPWKMISVGLVAAGICNILISFFPPFIGIILLWTVNAYAQSMLWSSILFVVTRLYDEKKAKLRMSVMITSVATGNIVGIIANMYFITKLGVIYAAVSIINTSMLSIYPLRYTNEDSCAGVSGILDFATYFGAGVSSAIYGVVIKHFGYLPMFVSWLVISIFSAIILHIISKRRDEIEAFC